MNRIALCSVVVLLAAGCGSSEPPARAPEPPPPPAATTSTQETTPQREGVSSLAASRTGTGVQSAETPSTDLSTTATGTSTTTTESTTPLTDDQILYVLHAANIAEMDQARMAEKKAKNARVKRFAAMMLKEHGEADSKGNEVAKKVRASLTPSDVSNRLETDAKQQMANVSSQGGSDFDRAYMDAQAKAHRVVLLTIERQLLPNVKSQEVRELLQMMRPKVEGHLHEAEDILKGLH